MCFVSSNSTPEKKQVKAFPGLYLSNSSQKFKLLIFIVGFPNIDIIKKDAQKFQGTNSTQEKIFERKQDSHRKTLVNKMVTKKKKKKSNQNNAICQLIHFKGIFLFHVFPFPKMSKFREYIYTIWKANY